MKYAIYYTWNDGFQDTINANNAAEKHIIIRDMIKRKEFKEIKYCPIYSSGEYGKRIKIL